MSRSYKKTPVSKGDKKHSRRWEKSFLHRAIRRAPLEDVPRKGNRFRSYYQSRTRGWRQSFREWMKREWREYYEMVEVIKNDFHRWQFCPAGSWKWDREKHEYIIREQDEWVECGYRRWKHYMDRYEKGPPDPKKEWLEFSKHFLRK